LPIRQRRRYFGGQQGYYHDDTGLYLLTHRYYDAGAGRFVTRDPIGYKGGLNLYGFAGNNPVNNSDPNGTTIIAPTENKAAYNKAITFLMKNPTMRKVITGLRKSKKTYHIETHGNDNGEIGLADFDPGDEDAELSGVNFRPDTAILTVDWHPYEGVFVKDSGGAIVGSQSPALVLGHELLHAYHYDLSKDYFNTLRYTPDAQYDTKEEKRTIATERGLAKFFGQTQRFNHDADSALVDSPLERPKP